MGAPPDALQFGAPWMYMPQGGDEIVGRETAARASRHLKRKEYDTVALSRSASGHKPNKLRVKKGGDIDDN
jgi:hypothetical protein